MTSVSVFAPGVYTLDLEVSTRRCVWQFGFDTDNPAAVSMALKVSDDAWAGNNPAPGTWLFDRMLLKAAAIVEPLAVAGRSTKFGEGDVQCGRVPSGVAFHLRCRNGTEIWGVADLATVVGFVAGVDALVPPDEVSYDVDAWLSSLQGGES